MGIGIHNLSSSGDVSNEASDLTAAIRQTASGILGTTVQLADLVRGPFSSPRFDRRKKTHLTASLLPG